MGYFSISNMPSQTNLKRVISAMKKLKGCYSIQFKEDEKLIRILIKENHTPPSHFVKVNLAPDLSQYTLVLYRKENELSFPYKLITIKEKGALDQEMLLTAIQEIFNSAIKSPNPKYYPL